MELLVNTEIQTRFDRYLKRIYTHLTQGTLEQNLRKGLIKVNGRKCKANLRVSTGDRVFISDKLNFKEQTAGAEEFSDSIKKFSEKLLQRYQIYCDDELIAINKPAGIAVQGGSKISLSIDDALKYLNTLSNDFRLVHRLDKSTSGVLLIAKGHMSAFKLTKAFKDRLIKKVYLAIVSGKPQKPSGQIFHLMTKNNNGVVSITEDDGKIAITDYKIIKDFGSYSLIEFMPLTGRTHQIRVHAQTLGCHIVGDIKYGSTEYNKGKLLLHAEKVILPQDIFGKEIVIKAALPDYFVPPAYKN